MAPALRARPPATAQTLATLPASLARQAGGLRGTSSPEEQLRRHPYNYAARKDLVGACRQVGDYAGAYYHAAWLAWLAPRSYAESDAGAAMLRDRSLEDRAARTDQQGRLQAVIAAVRAKRLLVNSSLSGTIAQHASGARSKISDLLAEAEQADSQPERPDPVARIASAQLCLTLDYALALEAAPASRPLRTEILRKAASRATDVCAWLPDSPGAHRTLAVIRARLAELDNRPELWGLAFAEAERAHQLDPDDTSLPEMLWVLHLRAGHWAEAQRWRQRAAATAAAGCPHN